MKNILQKILLAVIILTIPAYNCIRLISNSDSAAVSSPDKSFIDYFSGFDVREIERRISEKLELRSAYYEQLRVEEEKRLKIETMKNQLSEGTLTYRQVFSDTMIVGDSLMNGLEIYNVLDKANMITMVSASLYHLEGNIPKIINNNPKNLVLHYGINMMTNSLSQLDYFISMYEDIITELKSNLPDTRIFVSGVFKVSEAMTGRYAYLDKYNEALALMCQEYDVIFLDNSSCDPASGNYFGSDGIHVSKAFYIDLWLPHLLECIYS